MLLETLVAIALFTLTVALLAVLVVGARSVLLPGVAVEVVVNSRTLALTNGTNLLQALLGEGVMIPAACGGRGLCGQCKVTITRGSVPFFAVEQAHVTAGEARRGVRLACAHRVRSGTGIAVDEAFFEVDSLACTVVGARCVSALLREIRLQLPADSTFTFTPGQYVMVDAPPYAVRFDAFDIEADYRATWESEGLFQLSSQSAAVARRAYSLANAPDDGRTLELLVRLALPPASAEQDVPPGVVSSYLFGLAAGDTLNITGPYGDFRLLETDRDKVFVAGGAGMAPMRAILRQELAHPTSNCQLIFCYGARNLRDLCYEDEFAELARTHERFHWHVALSEPVAGTHWRGATGFIHTLLRDAVLARHPAPEEMEYYLCGPPLMNSATIALLRDYDVDADSIRVDHFGDQS